MSLMSNPSVLGLVKLSNRPSTSFSWLIPRRTSPMLKGRINQRGTTTLSTSRMVTRTYFTWLHDERNHDRRREERKGRRGMVWVVVRHTPKPLMDVLSLTMFSMSWWIVIKETLWSQIPKTQIPTSQTNDNNSFFANEHQCLKIET